MDNNRKINGFNNGRDALDGVGGQPSPFDLSPEQGKQLLKRAIRILNIEDSIHVTGRGQILTLNVRKNGYKDDMDIDEFIKDEFAIGKVVIARKEYYVIKAVESWRGLKTNPNIGLVVIPFREDVTIQVPEGSFVATPNDDKDDIREKFNKWLEQLGKNPKPKFKPMTNLEDSGFMGGIKEDWI
jgi:hypothetical protein